MNTPKSKSRALNPGVLVFAIFSDINSKRLFLACKVDKSSAK